MQLSPGRMHQHVPNSRAESTARTKCYCVNLYVGVCLQLCQEAEKDLSVCVIEKGAEVGKRGTHM